MRKLLGIDRNNFTHFICCRVCHKLYLESDVIVVNQTTTTVKSCSGSKFSKGKYKGKCGGELVEKLRLKDGNFHYRPHKVYCYRPVIESLESMLKRPGFEDQCEEWRTRKNNSLISDIFDGKIWDQFKTKPNGAPFLSVPHNYGLMVNVDWFQPYKHRSDISVGAVYLAVLNLPRSIRFKPENVMITAIIPPFRHEPKNINSFLEPLVKDLQHLWEPGVKMQTNKIPEGVHVGAALLNAAADIPAARKLCGFMGHNARLGCSKCLKQFKGAVGTMDFGGFGNCPKRTVAEHRRYAGKLNKCKSFTELKKMESQCGYRYTSLLKLPYFDTVRYHIVDPMHNLFMSS